MQNTSDTPVDCSGCEVLIGGEVVQIAPTGTIVGGQEFYVLAWGADIGAAIPVSGVEVTVRFPDDTSVSHTPASPVAGQSAQWNGSGWVWQQPTPGRGYDYWSTHPTPTAIP